MSRVFLTLIGSIVLAVVAAGGAIAKGNIVGVSWSNFQEERWKTDEAAMKKAISANGDKYVSADAQGSAAKQLSDVESLIAQGANDPRVVKSESDQMVEAMKERGVEVEYMVKDNEGHGFRNEENQFDFYRAMESFLSQHIGQQEIAS